MESTLLSTTSRGGAKREEEERNAPCFLLASSDRGFPVVRLPWERLKASSTLYDPGGGTSYKNNTQTLENIVKSKII